MTCNREVLVKKSSKLVALRLNYIFIKYCMSIIKSNKAQFVYLPFNSTKNASSHLHKYIIYNNKNIVFKYKT
jgi:hypothetical protein